MHILHSKHTKLKREEVEKLINNLNISLIQLPKIKVIDLALPENCDVGDVVKIERKTKSGPVIFYRVIAV